MLETNDRSLEFGTSSSLQRHETIYVGVHLKRETTLNGDFGLKDQRQINIIMKNLHFDT